MENHSTVKAAVPDPNARAWLDHSPAPRPGPVPSAFHVLCPSCGNAVAFPYDAGVGALIDELLYLEERLQSLMGAEPEVAP